MSNKNISNYINAHIILSFIHILFIISGTLSLIFISINIINITPLDMGDYISKTYLTYFYLQGNLLEVENIIIYTYILIFISAKISLIIISNYLENFDCIELIKLKLNDSRNSYYNGYYGKCKKDLNIIRKIYKYNKIEETDNIEFLDIVYNSDDDLEIIKNKFPTFYFNEQNNLSKYYYNNGIYKIKNKDNIENNNMFNTVTDILNSSNYTNSVISHIVNVIITVSVTIIAYDIYNISYGLSISIFAISITLISLIEPDINYI